MYTRHIQASVLEALRDTSVVVINGARQTGKSTFCKQLIRDQLFHAQYVSLMIQQPCQPLILTQGLSLKACLPRSSLMKSSVFRGCSSRLKGLLIGIERGGSLY